MAEAAPKGLFIVFHQDRHQHPGLSDLPGYRHDVINLCTRFWLLGYDLRVYVNLTKQEMQKTVENIANEKAGPNTDSSIFNSYSSLVLCILSHGGRGYRGGEIYGVDNQPVNINYIKLHFEDVAALRGKLKLFIIQACRGEEELLIPEKQAELPSITIQQLISLLEQEGKTIEWLLQQMLIKWQLNPVIYQDLLQEKDPSIKNQRLLLIMQQYNININQVQRLCRLDSNQQNSKEVTAMEVDDVQTATATHKNSTVTLWSNIDGCVSYVRPDKGSYFVEYLCDELMLKSTCTRTLENVFHKTSERFIRKSFELITKNGTTYYAAQVPVCDGRFPHTFLKVDPDNRTKFIGYYDDIVPNNNIANNVGQNPTSAIANFFNDFTERLLSRSSLRLQLNDDGSTKVDLFLQNKVF